MNVRQLAAIVVMMAFSSAVLANAATATGAGTLPWEAPLALIVASMTGPVAYAFSIIGIVIAMGIIIFGNDLNQFGRTIIYLVLVIALLVASVNILAGLFTTGTTASTSTIVGAVTAMMIVASGAMTTLQLGLMKLVAKFRKNDGDDDQLAAA